MDASALQMDPQQLIEVGVAAGCLVASGVFGFLLVRKARETRRRQIEEVPDSASAARRPALASPSTQTGEVPDNLVDSPEDSPSLRVPGKPARPMVPARAPKPELVETPRPTEAGGEPQEAKGRGDRAADPLRQIFPPKPAAGLKLVPPPPVALPEAPELEPERLTPPPEAPRRRDVEALGQGLARTRAGWISRLGQVFVGKREVDPAVLDDIEKILLTADIGVRTSQKLLEEMRTSLSKKELSSVDSIWDFLRRRTSLLLAGNPEPISWKSPGGPFVLLVIGVNGSGKTTTIGKLAAKLVADGKKVLVGAGDTFRAAAAEQLEIWAGRVGATIVRGKEGADPSSVLFEAVKRAKAEGFDVVIADTAGRLHTKTDLMEELQKVRRVIGKAAEGAPHETWLVIDSTSGQNAIAQAQIFTQAMAVSGIVLTKLDGTAKGGVILGIADQLQIPVRFVGIGERVEDLRAFDPEEFVEALYQQASSLPN